MKKKIIRLLIVIIIIEINFNLIYSILNNVYAVTKIYVSEGGTYTFNTRESSPNYTLGDSSIASVTTSPFPYAVANIGTTNAYTGDEVELEDCLYKFTANNNYYRISCNNVYLYLGRSRKGGTYTYYANYTSNANITVSNNNGTFTMSKRSGNTTYYLSFVTNNSYYTSATNTNNRANVRLYRPVNPGETSSTEIPGYIQASTITNGTSYLIVTQNGGNYYLLYPSTSTATNFSQTAKISSHTGTEYTITGNQVGTTTLIADGEEYEITVYDENTILEPDNKFTDKELIINQGMSYTLQKNTSSSITWTSSDTSIATVNSSGTVTGVSPGTTTVIAQIEGMRYAVNVTVKSGPTSRNISKHSYG